MITDAAAQSGQAIHSANTPTAAPPPLTTVVQVVAGAGHTCAITNAGGVLCWGHNDRGQLGNGGTTDSATPVEVIGLRSGVSAIAAGLWHTCALVNSGVQCWGVNEMGELGNGTRVPSLTPVPVRGLANGVVAIAAAGTLLGGHTCALTDAGAVRCWGLNFFGELGDGTEATRTVPVAVSGLSSGVTAIAAGGGHSCALMTRGIQCWGANSSGQLGDGTETDHSTPVTVSGLPGGVAAMAAGNSHTCALTGGGEMFCWGGNLYGQLGDGSESKRSSPSKVNGLPGNVSAIAAGGSHTCALLRDNSIHCWGDNEYGQLGNGTATTHSSQPLAVSAAGRNFAAITAGSSHTCALTDDGSVQCWGHNFFGQLGDDAASASKSIPVAVQGLAHPIPAIAVGTWHTCALTEERTVHCWGRNGNGQLGDGTTISHSQPLTVSGSLTAVTTIAAGDLYSCAVTGDGGALCWGHNFYGQLGNGTTTDSSTPVAVSGLQSGVTALAGGNYHTCAVANGGVQCWGYNSFGALGDGTNTPSNVPVAVGGLTANVSTVAVGASHSCAITNGGGVQCWGFNSSGQLGDGTETSRSTPVNVGGLTSGVSALAAGTSHSCALTAVGGVVCWGSNRDGQLGDGTAVDSSLPVAVSGLASGVIAIAAGGNYSCALTADGRVLCWGQHFTSLFGIGTDTASPSPVVVPGLASGVSALGVGPSHACALNDTGSQCWGANHYGQLGVNPGWMPVDVVQGAPSSLSNNQTFLPVIHR
ncbi:MAG: hypothetical protein R2932_07085 [Caldilineaceae bacterium]